MGYLIALFAFLARLFRPSQGVHAAPYGYARELYAETTRSPRRTRVMHAEGEPSPRIPAPRKPVGDLPRAGAQPSPRTTEAGLPQTAMSAVRPAVEPHVMEPAAMVRPAYRHWERERARAEHRARVDRDRLGLAVLMDVAARANAIRDTDEVAK